MDRMETEGSLEKGLLLKRKKRDMERDEREKYR